MYALDLKTKTNDDKWVAIVLCAIYESPRQPTDTQDSDQDTSDSQLNGMKRNSSEPSLDESPNACERSSKVRRVSSDHSLPCYPHEPQGNLASSSTAQVVQAASSAVSDHELSFTSEDHGLQQFQSSLRHQETQTSSSQKQDPYPSTCTSPEANICDLSDMDELLSGWDELQSSLSHQGIQMLSSDQQHQFNLITSIDVGDADIFNMDDDVLAGLKELDILLSSPTISTASICM